MHAKHPRIAERWSKKYKTSKNLPEKKKKSKKKASGPFKKKDTLHWQAVIVDKGVAAGKPVTRVDEDDEIPAYYSDERGTPEDAQIWSREEAEAARKERKKKSKKEAVWTVKNSQLHGLGLFSNQAIAPGQTIVKAAKRMGGQDGLDRYEITFATRYTNHSSTPNARLKKVASGRVEIIAEQPIKVGAEVLVDYHRTQSALGPGSYMTYRGKVRATRDQLEKQAEEGLKFVEKTIELPAADKLRDAHPGSDADADRFIGRAARRHTEKYPPAKRQRVPGRHRALLESIRRRHAAERGQLGQRTWAKEREFLGERLDPVRDWWQENNQPRWMSPWHPYGNGRHLPPYDTRPPDPNSPRERFRRVVIPLLRPVQNTFDKVEDYLRGPQPPGMTPGSRGLAPPTEKESQAMPQPQQQPAPQPQQPGQEQPQPGFVPGSIAAQAAVTPEQQAHVSPEAVTAAQQQGQQPAQPEQPGAPVQPQQPPQAIQQAKQGASLFLDRIKRATGPELAPSPLINEAKNQMNVVAPQPDPIMAQKSMKPPVPQLGGQMPIATPSSTSLGVNSMSGGAPPMPKLAAEHNQWLAKNAVNTSTALLAGGALLGTAAGIPIVINKWKESRKEEVKLEKAIERNLRERRARRVAGERWEEEKKKEEEEELAEKEAHPHDRQNEDEEEEFPTGGLIGAGLGVGAGLALPNILGSEQEFDTAHQAIQDFRSLDKPPAGHTWTSAYHRALAPAAGLTPFGKPIGDLLVATRRQPALLKALGMDEHLITSPDAAVDSQQHYNAFRRGPVPAYYHYTANRGRGIPGKGPAEGSMYPDWLLPKFRAFMREQSPTTLPPNEINTEMISIPDQADLVKAFHTSLSPEDMAEVSRVENDLWGQRIEDQVDNYGPIMEQGYNSRKLLKGIGYGVAGAAGAYGLYRLIKYMASKPKEEEEEEMDVKTAHASLNIFHHHHYKSRKDKKEEKERQRRVGFPMLPLIGAAGVAGAGLALPSAMGSDKEWGDINSSWDAWNKYQEGHPGRAFDDPVKDINEPTRLMQYSDFMGRAVRPNILGQPMGPMVAHMREKPWFMGVPDPATGKSGLYDIDANVDKKFLGVPYGRYIKQIVDEVETSPTVGPAVSEIRKILAEGVGQAGYSLGGYTGPKDPDTGHPTWQIDEVKKTEALAHYQAFRRGPLASYSHMVMGPRRTIRRGEFQEGQYYGDVIGPAFNAYVKKEHGALPNEIGVPGSGSWAEMTHEKQLGVLQKFHNGLPAEQQELKHRVETNLMADLENNVANYGPMIEGGQAARGTLRQVGYGVAGIAALYGTYRLIRYLVVSRREKKEEEEQVVKILPRAAKKAASYNRVKAAWDANEKTARKTPAPWWVPAPGKKKKKKPTTKRRRKGAPRTTTRTKVKRDGKKGESTITTRSRPGKKVKKSYKW
jgi:hypothetical protein